MQNEELFKVHVDIPTEVSSDLAEPQEDTELELVMLITVQCKVPPKARTISFNNQPSVPQNYLYGDECFLDGLGLTMILEQSLNKSGKLRQGEFIDGCPNIVQLHHSKTKTDSSNNHTPNIAQHDTTFNESMVEEQKTVLIEQQGRLQHSNVPVKLHLSKNSSQGRCESPL